MISLNKELMLYKVKFGSVLYGTNTPDSDIDYKGIFLPKLDDLILGALGNKCDTITKSTGNDNSKNDKNDVDEQSWSLQYWLSLVKQGDTGALDVLFSYSYSDVIEFCDDRIKPLFENPLKLFNPLTAKAYVGYAIGQSQKYGIKGTRLGVIKNVYNFINSIKHLVNFEEEKLDPFIPVIIRNFYEKSYCFSDYVSVQNKDVLSLCLCGKIHQGNITLQEFFNRLERVYNEYGKRAKQAEENKGVDWKAVSHAVRCIFQMKELLNTGKIQFPLKNANEIKEIKLGNVEWKDVDLLISNGLDEIDNLIKNSNIKGEYDENFVKSVIYSLYF